MVHSQAVAQERGQGGIQRLAGPQQGVIDIVPRATATDFLQVGLHGLEVALAQGAGIATHDVGHLQPLEPRRPREGKVQFVVVQEVENHHVVPPAAEQFQPAEQAVPRREQVGDEDHHSPPGKGLGDLAEDRVEVGLVAGRADFQGLEDRFQVVPLGPQGHDHPHLLVEGNAAHGVLLAQQQVGQAAGDRGAVLELVHRPAAVAHAAGDVDQHGAAEVGVLFELLDVVAVLLGPQLPVDVPGVVAEGVLAVLAKLDRLAEVGTAMHAGEETLDDVAGPHFQPRDPLDRVRMQKSSGIAHRGSTRLLAWGLRPRCGR